jgi:hypothetical protein
MANLVVTSTTNTIKVVFNDTFKTSALKIVVSEQLPDYREYKVWRIAGIYEPF